MTTYRCPVCQINDPNAYMLCYHPGCPDGRDTMVRQQAENEDARLIAKMWQDRAQANTQ